MSQDVYHVTQSPESVLTGGFITDKGDFGNRIYFGSIERVLKYYRDYNYDCFTILEVQIDDSKLEIIDSLDKLNDYQGKLSSTHYSD